MISHLFLANCSGYLCGIAEEVKISTCGTRVDCFSPNAESVIVHVISGLLELVGQAIIGVVEVESDVTLESLSFWKTRTMTYSSSSLLSWKACNLRACAMPANGSLCSKIPLLSLFLSLGRLVSNPKNDMVKSQVLRRGAILYVPLRGADNA
jgi:hypothetical protein